MTYSYNDDRKNMSDSEFVPHHSTPLRKAVYQHEDFTLCILRLYVPKILYEYVIFIQWHS